MESEIGIIIAERTFTAVHSDGSQSTVKVVLGMPRIKLDSRYQDFATPYMISACGETRSRHATGIDSFQSLQLALSVLGAELEAIKQRYGVSLKWEGDEAGGLGFS